MPEFTADGKTVPGKTQLLEWQKQGRQFTRSGYGRKIPTFYMVQLPGSPRWRRVYCCIFSNSGTCYVEDMTRPPRVREGGTVARPEWIIIDVRLAAAGNLTTPAATLARDAPDGCPW